MQRYLECHGSRSRPLRSVSPAPTRHRYLILTQAPASRTLSSDPSHPVSTPRSLWISRMYVVVCVSFVPPYLSTMLQVFHSQTACVPAAGNWTSSYPLHDPTPPPTRRLNPTTLQHVHAAAFDSAAPAVTEFILGAQRALSFVAGPRTSALVLAVYSQLLEKVAAIGFVKQLRTALFSGSRFPVQRSEGVPPTPTVQLGLPWSRGE